MNKNTAKHGLMRSFLGASLALLLTLGSSPSWAQTSTMNIDHLKTGFALSGSHTSQRCENCHINGVFKGTPRDCASCHTGIARRAPTQVVVKPQQHFPTQASCDSCHNTLTFSGAKFNHMGVAPSSCATCHNGFITAGKPSGHIVTSLPCSACHRTAAWVPPLKPDHSQFTVATVCSTCHNGSTATGKTATHIPTSLNCISCHNTNAWKPTQWNHSQQSVVNQCATCHSGAYPPADGRPANHIPYQALTGVTITNCDTCHKSGYVSWNPGLFHSNVSVTTQCATCHLSSAYGLTSKPATATHASVTGNCEGCHRTTSSWVSSKPDHSLFTVATNCGNCHNGTTALGKPGNHMPTSLNCISCHSATASVFTPNTWNHTQQPVVNLCSNCHTGSYLTGLGKPANHIPYQVLSGVAITNCDTCHKAGYASWYPGKFHSNVSVTMQCSNCHLSSIYGLTSKPATATHATVTGFCESCHRSTSTWLSVQYTHSPANAVGTGTCDTCHNGITALGKPANHIPIPAGTAKCDSCHLGQVTFTAPYSMNHSVVSTATCKSCHSGSYTSIGSQGAQATTSISNHIPLAQLLNGTAMDCKDCHSSTTSFATEKMNHNSSLGNGAGWCTGCHKTGTSYQGSMQKMSLTHQSSGKTDCSVSGCHKPLGNTGTS
jgi:hypothetical protein